jgi:hypothetical protein
MTFPFVSFAATALVAMVAAPVAGWSDEPRFNLARGLGSEFEKICAGMLQSFACARAIESRQLSRGVRGISRRGAVLVIHTRSGRVVALEDTEQEGSEQSFSYLKPMTRIGFHLVHVQYSEWIEYLLVDMSSGAQFRIEDVPILSPDGAHFATASFDPDETGVSSLQIWRLAPGGPQLEWRHEPKEWGPASPVWRSATHLEVAKLDAQWNRIGTTVVALGHSGWELGDR